MEFQLPYLFSSYIITLGLILFKNLKVKAVYLLFAHCMCMCILHVGEWLKAIVDLWNSVLLVYVSYLSCGFQFLCQADLYITSVLFICRWIWCLHHSVLRQCYSGTVYWRDCRRSDRLWVLGNHTHTVLFTAWRRCPCAGNATTVLCHGSYFLYILHYLLVDVNVS